MCVLGAIVGLGLEATASPILSYGPEKSRAPASSRMSTVTVLTVGIQIQKPYWQHALVLKWTSIYDRYPRATANVYHLYWQLPVGIPKRKPYLAMPTLASNSQWTGQPNVVEVYVSTTISHLVWSHLIFWLTARGEQVLAYIVPKKLLAYRAKEKEEVITKYGRERWPLIGR